MSAARGDAPGIAALIRNQPAREFFAKSDESRHIRGYFSDNVISAVIPQRLGSVAASDAHQFNRPDGRPMRHGEIALVRKQCEGLQGAAAEREVSEDFAMSVTAQRMPPPVTAEEFLASTTRLGPGKHQLIDGVIVAMAPASPTHGLIQARLARLIGNHIDARKLPCRVITEAGVKPRVRGRTNVRVPDLLVTCGPPPQPGDGIVHDPVLIIEVLSPSNDDETESAIMSCASIPSVREMLVVDSVQRRAEVWRRDGAGTWPVDPQSIDASGIVRLDSLDLDLSLDAVYADTHLA